MSNSCSRKLRMYRERSQLKQSDVCFIMGVPVSVNVSQWEHGTRNPTLETILLYHVLFGVPIESLFAERITQIQIDVAERSKLLLVQLRSMPPTIKVQNRISFLESFIAKVTMLSHEN